MGTENNTLGNHPADVATVVLLAQTPHLDMQLVSDVGWVDYAGEPRSCHSRKQWSAQVSAVMACGAARQPSWLRDKWNAHHRACGVLPCR